MASGGMTASFVLKLEDQLTNGLVKLQRTFENLKRVADRLNLGGLVNVDRTLDAATNGAIRLTTALGRLEKGAHNAWSALRRMAGGVGAAMKQASERVGVIGGAVAGYSITAPIRAYAGYENTLRHIAITEQLSGSAAEAEIVRLKTMLNRDALASGQSSEAVASAFRDLVTSGMGEAMAEKLIGIHSRAATAYNISPEALGQAVFALNQNLGIGPDQMEGALSAMAFAAKEGKFSVEDFSQFLPMITSTFGKLGMKGRPAADAAFAALETVRMNTGDAGTAATDLNDLLNYLTSPFAQRSFAKAGIDIGAVLRKAEAQGINPFDEINALLRKQTNGMTPVQLAQTLGLDVHNMQGRDAAVALLQHSEHYEQLRRLFAGIDAGTLSRDFITAFKAPEVQMRIFSEELHQLNRRVGEGFSPLMMRANLGLKWLGDTLDKLDAAFPGAANDVILGVGGLLALIATLGAIGFVAPALAAGFGLIADLVMAGGSLVMGLGSLAIGAESLAALLAPAAPVIAGLIGLGGALMGILAVVKTDPGLVPNNGDGMSPDGITIAGVNDGSMKLPGRPKDERDDDTLSFREQLRDAGVLIGQTAAALIGAALTNPMAMMNPQSSRGSTSNRFLDD
jgi:hypothetical protein